MLKILALWLTHLIAIIIFMNGFFQMKSNLEGFATKDDFPSVPTTNSSIPYTFSLKNVVLIIIDALRTDFVTNENSKINFPFVNKMLREKKAILFNAKAHHPTVTLPRIKAITSGGIPGFMDVLYNFHSTEFSDDNIVTQSVLNGKNVIFYGDDTWLRLFPHHFKRSEGTTSFFVSDYTEVDNNVTKNVKNELKRRDWDFLILHYLGLDHIGHKQGPFSDLVPGKLKEMDEIIKNIHTQLEKRGDPSMIIVCGDHGMSDSGSHGGASKEETSVPVLFLHNRNRFLSQNVVNINQISITPTLSVLLNIPIPKNNLGAVLSDALIDLNAREKLYAMLINFWQMSKLKGDFDVNENKAVKMHRKWLEKMKINPLLDIVNETKVYSDVINELSEELSLDLTRQDIPLVLFGVFVLWMVFVFAFLLQLKELRASFTSLLDKFLFFAWILHSLSFFSSSFIEEEQMLLYFYSSMLHLLLLFENLSQKNVLRCSYIVLCWICSRFMRNWNQTGDKWASLPDLNKWINKPENHIYLSASLFCGFILIFSIRSKHIKTNKLNTILSFIEFALIFICKISELLGLPFQKNLSSAIYIIIALMILNDFSMSSLITSWLILSCFLMRPHNIALLALMNLQEHFIFKILQISNNYRIISVYYMQAMTSFFLQGNSNSLSRIDVATGFVGLSDYYPAFVAFLLICHTYSTFIFWTLSSIFRITQNSNKIRKSSIIASTTSLMCLIRALPVVTTVLTLTIQRNHLFVWSVFAPKLLYESLHSLFTSFVLFFLWSVVYLQEKIKLR